MKDNGWLGRCTTLSDARYAVGLDDVYFIHTILQWRPSRSVLLSQTGQATSEAVHPPPEEVIRAG